MKKYRKRKLATGIAVAIAVLVGAFIWHNSKNSGEIRTLGSSEVLPAAAQYLQYDSQNVSFEYPGKYTFQDLPARAGDQEVKKFTAKTVYDKNISFVISDLPDGRLENNSAHNLRQARDDLYRKRTALRNGQPVTVWVKNNRQEQTAFITNGNRVAIFAFTQDQGGTIPDLNPEVDRLIESFEWK